jgi:hypothetical protein
MSKEHLTSLCCGELACRNAEPWVSTYKQCGRGSADSNDTHTRTRTYVLPMATTKLAACRILADEMQCMWWEGYDIITVILQLVYSGERIENKTKQNKWKKKRERKEKRKGKKHGLSWTPITYHTLPCSEWYIPKFEGTNLTVKDNFQLTKSRMRFVARLWIWMAEPPNRRHLATA